MEQGGSPAYRDRRTGLILFGILLILLGALCTLLVPFLFVVQKLQSETTGAPPDYRMVVPSALTYLALAVSFVWLGIGSILCRRWARTLILFIAWSWLIVGIAATALMAFVLPRLFADEPELAGVGIASILAVAGFFMFVFYIAAPGALVLFYRSPHVRATCEARDPLPRWTDTCPFPVLGGALSFALGALSLFVMPLGYRAVFPLFGALVTGFPAVLLYVAMGLTSLWMAWGLFRMRTVAWVASIVMIVVAGLSTMITFMRVDILDIYGAMGFSAGQLDEVGRIGSLGSTSVAVTALSILLLLAYMLWLKKYFRDPLVSNAPPD